jgi:hypothetical protein
MTNNINLNEKYDRKNTMKSENIQLSVENYLQKNTK